MHERAKQFDKNGQPFLDLAGLCASSFHASTPNIMPKIMRAQDIAPIIAGKKDFNVTKNVNRREPPGRDSRGGRQWQ